MKYAVGNNVATITASVPGAFLQKYRLNVGLEALIIQRVIRRRVMLDRSGRLSRRSMTHPLGNHLPLRIALRLPKFSAGMRWIAASGRSEGMQQQAALEWIAGRNQLRDKREILA